MFGQFIRIQKQHKIEDEFEKIKASLTTVLTNIEAQSKELEDKTSHLVNYVTGGDSHFYYVVGQNLTPHLAFMFEGVYVGDYPTNNVRIGFKGDVNIITSQIDLPNVNRDTINRVNTQFTPVFLTDNTYLTYIIFGADNKTWIQMLELVKHTNHISVKSTVRFNNTHVEPIEYNVDILDWSKFSLPIGGNS